jgi:hypothetical protein
MRWQDERYVRIYTRDTPDWIALGWEAQALFMLILRKVDRAGIMELGKQGRRGLTLMFGMPSDVAERALNALLEDGCIELARDRLIVRNFVDAQEASISDAARKRAQREKDREVARAREDVTRNDDHNVSRAVTRGHAASQPVTPSLAVPSEPITTTASAGAMEVQPDQPDPLCSPAPERRADSPDVPTFAPVHESHALGPPRASNGHPDAGSLPPESPPAGPDFLAMAHDLAEGGNAFARKMLDRGALGGTFTTAQRRKIEEMYAERQEGQANAARVVALRNDSGPPTPRSASHGAPDRQAVALWSSLWSKEHRGETYPTTERDLQCIRKLVERAVARAQAVGGNTGPGDVLAHYFARYLALDDKRLVAERYPLCFLESRLPAIGEYEPARARPTSAAPVASPPERRPLKVPDGVLETVAAPRSATEALLARRL